MSGPDVVVAALCRRDGQVLVERRGYGAAAGEWGLPGGPVARRETLAEAIVRHVDDCAGLAALCGPFLDWDETIEGDRHVVRLRFEAVALDEPGLPAQRASALEVEWVATEELLERRLESGLAEFLADQGLIEGVM